MENEYPNVNLPGGHVFALEVVDNHSGEELVEESLVDHVELDGGVLRVEVNTDEPLPG